MNSFGKLFRVSIFGESHGEGLGIIIDGCPAGIPLNLIDFKVDLDRRKALDIPGTTERKELDLPEIISGYFNGKTTGAPLTILFKNENTRKADYEVMRNTPRPGHADFVASVKYGGNEDYRGGGHFSGRLTLCLVAVGVVAKKILARTNLIGSPLEISAQVIEVGANKNIEEAIAHAIKEQDSIGGLIECRVTNLPIGLGEPFFDSVESLISHAVFSIPAIKGIEFGSGFNAATMRGSEHNDSLENINGRTTTNHAGGIVGGITNGNDLVFKVVVKPTSSTPKTQTTLNIISGKQESLTVKGRHDLCIALRVPVVVEAVTAMVLVDLFLREQSIKRK